MPNSRSVLPAMWPHLDEHSRFVVAASQAVELDYGGISRFSRACAVSRVTLTRGSECDAPGPGPDSPGTSKWNMAEHWPLSFKSCNWRGEPLPEYETVLRLIAGTTTARGIRVTRRLDRRRYPVGREITDEESLPMSI